MTTWREEIPTSQPHLMCDMCGQTEEGNLYHGKAAEDCELSILSYFRDLGWHRYEKDRIFVDLCENCAHEAEQEGKLENYEKVY